jgi:hypothetical protein
MGIYPSGIVYGIKIYNLLDDVSNILFERQYNDVMNYNNRKETKLFYDNIPENTKKYLRFLIYTECSSSCEDDFMIWYPISLDVFLKEFPC